MTAKLRSNDYPVTHLANPEFEYVPASRTDVRATIMRAKARLQARESGSPKVSAIGRQAGLANLGKRPK